MDRLTQFFPSLLTLAGVLVVLWAGLWVVSRMIRRLAAKSAPPEQNGDAWTEQLIGFVRSTVVLVSVVAIAVVALSDAGHGVAGITWSGVSDWLTGPGLHIVLILLFGYVLIRMVDFIINRFQDLLLARMGDGADRGEHRKRVNTVGKLLRAITVVLIAGSAVLMALRQINVDITPILTGAGVMGVAVGFGAQNLVRDIISGLFLILEDQVRVGDVAQINGKGGLVEAIHLRTIVLRDEEGTVHIFPNGAVTQISNLTKDFSYALLKIGVAYKENTDEVFAVLKRVGDGLEADPEFAPRILGAIELLGIDSFGDSAVVLKIRMKTRPIQQWGVARELRRRIKLEFDRLGIEMPFPHISLYTGEASKPLAVRLEGAEAAEGAPRAATAGED